MKLDTPVLLIVFNRPENAKKVLDSIRKVAPKKLYLAADGPRRDNVADIENSRLTRKLLNEIDWPCEVKTLFSEKNLGCGLGPKRAIDWLFENEEKGIILEDDCLPSKSFFEFCSQLLEKYQNDTRIMHISGSNFQNGYIPDPDYSYYYSYFSHEWGWASWRRAWKLYDFNISTYPEIRSKGYLDDYFSSYFEKKYRLSKIDRTQNSSNVSWWDYQWDYAKIINSGLSIIPNHNLITNIGFGKQATHTKSTNDIREKNYARELDFPLMHPPFIIRNSKADKRYFSNFFSKVILLRKVLSVLKVKGYSAKG